jgi:integrase/recombinase XerD
MSEKKIRDLANEFILYKRALGYLYETQEFHLIKYIDYTELFKSNTPYLKKNITLNYLRDITFADSTICNIINVLREFSRYLLMQGYERSYIIPPKQSSITTAEPPYFFTQKEINLFFNKVDQVKKNPSYKGREFVLPAIFRLLYCCGLRCKEARTLESYNVHIDELYIDIVQSKGYKSRRIFISEELANYLNNYNNQIRLIFKDRKYYFPHGDKCYKGAFISNNFNNFWKEAFPDFIRTTRPRAYDFRHHFVWANLNKWAAEGFDLNVMIAYLMRYMGHQTINETLYYFRFVPEFYPTYNKMTKLSEEILPEVPDEK